MRKASNPLPATVNAISATVGSVSSRTKRASATGSLPSVTTDEAVDEVDFRQVVHQRRLGTRAT